MQPLSLEPYAVQQRWTLAEALPPAGWARLFSRYLEAAARRCVAAGPCVIGHLKALALLPAGGYVRLSVLAPERPAEAEVGEGDAAATAVAVTLTLNAHVYGLPAGQVAQCVDAAAAEVAARWDAVMRPVAAGRAGQPAKA
jgi:hypothetical protein